MELTIAACAVIVLFGFFYAIALIMNACVQPDWVDDGISPDSPTSGAGDSLDMVDEDALNLQEGRRSRVCRCGVCLTTARKRGMRSE